jgi:GT2 family glycosyltransferase
MYPGEVGSNPDPVFSPCAAAALYRLQSVRAVGGFDEAYFCYHEDVDLVFRLRLAGARCHYVESSVVHHVGSGLTGRDSDFSVYHGHRNLVWTYVKNMPGMLVFWYLPQHLLLNLVTVIHYTLRGRGRVIFRSKWHALSGLGYALRQRAEIQSARTVESSEILSAMTRGLLRPYLSRFR